MSILSENLNRVPLHAEHVALGGKMVPFAGFEMPVRYGSETLEHLAVREKAGLFDVSHMGEFRIKGPDALALLLATCSNDASLIGPGKVQYTCLMNNNGGVVDDLLVYCLSSEEYMVVVNASNIEKDWNWFNANKGALNLELTNESSVWGLLALQGPLAESLLQPLVSVDLKTLPYYSFCFGKVAGVDNVMISATGYTGAGGYELMVPAENSEGVWKALLAAGALPAGLAARDTLRLEMGYCLYGNELNDTISPLEASLAWATKLNRPFVGHSILEAQKAAGLKRKRCGIRLIDKGIPRRDYAVCDAYGAELGIITSGAPSPILNQGIAMAYLPPTYTAIGTKVFVKVRERLLQAEVVKLPFITENNG
jgi:aminomethyltransferase